MGIAKRLNLVMVSAFALLLGCLMFTMQPTYALEEKSVSSWSELESNFKTAENTITIPEDTIVTVTGELRVPTGEYTLTGGGILQRSDLRAYEMIRINDGSTLNLSNITIDGESSPVSSYKASDIGVYGTLNADNVTFQNKSFGEVISSGSSGTVNIQNCTFNNNSSVISTAFNRVSNTGGTAKIYNTEFINNIDSCISLGYSGVIESCTFTNNIGTDIQLENGTTQISNCTINDESNSGVLDNIKGWNDKNLKLNSLNESSGWAIVSENANVDITGCTIKNNELAIYFNYEYGTLNIQDSDLAGKIIKVYKGDTKIEGGEVAGIYCQYSSCNLDLIGTKVTDFISCEITSISGNVQITAPVFRSSSTYGYFTITEALGPRAYIAVGGDLTYSFKGAAGDYYDGEYLNIKYLAMPGNRYTITDDDISKFYINRNTDAWDGYLGSLSQEEVNKLNIITYSDIYSNYGHANITDGNIYIWSGPKLREENIPDTGEDEEQDPTTPSNPGETSGNMSIYGTVQPITMIDVTVPLTIQFTIESDRTFTGPDSIEIKSNCPSPLDVNLYGVNKDDGAPSLVAPDTHSDDEWNNLSRAETLASMALILDNTSLSSTGSTLGRIDSAFQSEKALDLDLSAKYGKAWDNSEDLVFTYNVVFEFAMP